MHNQLWTLQTRGGGNAAIIHQQRVVALRRLNSDTDLRRLPCHGADVMVLHSSSNTGQPACGRSIWMKTSRGGKDMTRTCRGPL